MSKVAELISLTIDARIVFRCDKCGASERGRAGEFYMGQPELTRTVRQQLDRCAVMATNSSMPFGWAGYGSERHHCPKCVSHEA